MKAIQAHPQQGLNGLMLVDLPDPADFGPNAIRVRVHANSPTPMISVWRGDGRQPQRGPSP